MRPDVDEARRSEPTPNRRETQWLRRSWRRTARRNRLRQRSQTFDAGLVGRSRPLPALTQVAQDLARRVMTRCAGNPTARMRPRSAVVQVLQRAAVTRVTQQRPQREQLIERQLAVKDVAGGQPELGLEIRG